MIFVRVEFGALFTEDDGTVVVVNAQPEGTWEAISDSLYRRNRWQGLFRRHLVRARGYGREFWIDEVAARVARASGALAAAQARYERIAGPRPKKRGCGCGQG